MKEEVEIIETIIDPDILKIQELAEAIERMGFGKTRDLLIEYHNAITMGLCPCFVNTYNKKYNELQEKGKLSDWKNLKR